MKTALIATAFLFLVVPAHGQDRASQLNFNGWGVGSGGVGFGGSSISRLSFSTSRTEHYTYTYAQGSATTYSPTRFVSFETGLKLAKEMQAYQPKSLGEIAAEYRVARKPAK